MIEMNEIANILNTMDDKALETLSGLIRAEQACRARKKREKLIGAFHLAFNNLQDADIRVGYCDDDNDIYAMNWGGFDFSD